MNSLSRLAHNGTIRRAYRLAVPAIANFSSHEGGAFAPPFVVRRPEVAPVLSLIFLLFFVVIRTC